jgi:allophanate hydrolase
MTNLLDLCAVAIPAGVRSDGLPFGVQLLAPAFNDLKLLDLAARWCGEIPASPATPSDGLGRDSTFITDGAVITDGTVLLAVAGAHLSGQPLNPDLLRLGGQLAYTARTDASYRMFEIPGPLRRPGLIRRNGAIPGAGDGIEVEVWRLPASRMGSLLASVLPPLAIGPMDLADGTRVMGFVCTTEAADAGRDITSFGGWRNFLAAATPTGVPLT